jgi:hypothetical protein
MNFLSRHDAEFSLPALAEARANKATCCDRCETPAPEYFPAIIGSSVYAHCEDCQAVFDSNPWAFQDAIIEESRKALAGGFPIPCPKPSPVLSISEAMKADVDDPRTADHGWRRGMEAATRNHAPYDGFTAWGRAFEGGLKYGRHFV